MKQTKNVCELPVMKASCKTCPFRKLENGRWQDTELANTVINRTLFKSQQICHGTEGPNREARNRCRGAFDHNKEIYDRIPGYQNLIQEQPMKLVVTADSIVVKITQRNKKVITHPAEMVQGDEKLCKQYLMELYEQKHNSKIMISVLGKKLWNEVIEYVETYLLKK